MDKLKARIDEMYPTRAAFADALGVEPYTLSRMLSSGNWKADNMKVAIELLKIDPSDIPAYFFDSVVALKATKENT